jgi:hypothetical protein
VSEGKHHLPSINNIHQVLDSASSKARQPGFLSRRSSSQDLLDEFNELVKQKYKLPELEEFMQMDYKERNQQLYELLKHFRICVIPSSKIESFDHLPHFQIIETSLRDIKRMPGKGRKKDGNNSQSVKAQTE